MNAVWPWVALAGLGAFHGLNPAMGWLFAVALGLQRESRAAVLQALLPIAAGHALSVAAVIVAISVLRVFFDITALEISAAVALIAFGLYRLVARHRGRAGMQVSGAQLLLWSFLMATAHGAGLMLIPVLLGMPIGDAHSEHSHHVAAFSSIGVGAALAALGIHTLAMLAAAGAVAIVVYEWAGLAFLRRSWINIDLIWVFALIGAGVILLVMALR
ncbi:hypothetical protein GCM10011487_55010 [Steroidobacter agaridevorans]|uniref:Uncharacterized protein n=1 Tax=Steroidobacter agaridevorans TaxID=2695856 RepID=A0A829YKX7_9GAMM|nr:hypothetical protein [Steroidobacter agaridevorans]GFE83501.1 hypothetical protein GCM10011487_55010 [Steroidobacter agaridevorans]